MCQGTLKTLSLSLHTQISKNGGTTELKKQNNFLLDVLVLHLLFTVPSLMNDVGYTRMIQNPEHPAKLKVMT